MLGLLQNYAILEGPQHMGESFLWYLLSVWLQRETKRKQPLVCGAIIYFETGIIGTKVGADCHAIFLTASRGPFTSYRKPIGMEVERKPLFARILLYPQTPGRNGWDPEMSG